MAYEIDDHIDGVLVVSSSGGGAKIKGTVNQSLQIHMHLHIDIHEEKSEGGKVFGFLRAFTGRRKKQVALTPAQTDRVFNAISEGINYVRTEKQVQMPLLHEDNKRDRY